MAWKIKSYRVHYYPKFSVEGFCHIKCVTWYGRCNISLRFTCPSGKEPIEIVCKECVWKKHLFITLNFVLQPLEPVTRGNTLDMWLSPLTSHVVSWCLTKLSKAVGSMNENKPSVPFFVLILMWKWHKSHCPPSHFFFLVVLCGF